MTTTPLPDLTEHLGPAPFRFTPKHETVASPAFSLPFKVLAVSLLLGLAFWAYQLHGPQMAQTDYLWLWAAWGIMAYTVGHLLLGKTRLTSQTLEQTWIWHKNITLFFIHATCKGLLKTGIPRSRSNLFIRVSAPRRKRGSP